MRGRRRRRTTTTCATIPIAIVIVIIAGIEVVGFVLVADVLLIMLINREFTQEKMTNNIHV